MVRLWVMDCSWDKTTHLNTSPQKLWFFSFCFVFWLFIARRLLSPTSLPQSIDHISFITLAKRCVPVKRKSWTSWRSSVQEGEKSFLFRLSDGFHHTKCCGTFRFCRSVSYKNVEKKKKKRLVPCTWKWHPINSNRILLGLAASAGAGHSVNPESSPPSLLKAFSLMTLQRWEEVAAQKGLESKGGIDPGTRPSFVSLPPASSSSSSPHALSPLSPLTSLCQFSFPLLLFPSF